MTTQYDIKLLAPLRYSQKTLKVNNKIVRQQ